MCHYLLSRLWKALCKPELMADRFLNTKWVVVVADIQSQHMKYNVQFISITKRNKAIFQESKAPRNNMDFEILTEAQTDILLQWYSSYIATSTKNKKNKKPTLCILFCLQLKSERNTDWRLWPIWGEKKKNKKTLLKENYNKYWFRGRKTHYANLSEMQRY